MKPLSVFLIVCVWVASPSSAVAQCIGCPGDLAITKSADDLWGNPATPDNCKHTHDFGALCDATNLADFSGEVHIFVTVVADLEGADRYVTANFVSGLTSTPITSGNGFIGAPADGKFFETGGVTGCGGEENKVTVQLDYDDFNALLAAGDGTMTVEIIAGSAVEDLCDLCCESGHAWTPDPCCNDLIPCACPPAVASSSEVVLIYLDCNVVGDPFECEVHAECDDALYCTGVEQCVDGRCINDVSPCLASGKICVEATSSCVNCATDQECKDEDGLFCNGDETCSSGACQPALSQPCTLQETCNEAADTCTQPLECPPS